MIINWITIKVKDFEKSKEFYRDFLGMKEENEFSPNGSMVIAFFAADNGIKIELIYDKNLKLEACENSNISIGICPSNYDDLLKQSRDRKIILGEPVILGGHTECFFVNDPNGIGVQIIK